MTTKCQSESQKILCIIHEPNILTFATTSSTSLSHEVTSSLNGSQARTNLLTFLQNLCHLIYIHIIQHPLDCAGIEGECWTDSNLAPMDSTSKLLVINLPNPKFIFFTLQFYFPHFHYNVHLYTILSVYTISAEVIFSFICSTYMLYLKVKFRSQSKVFIIHQHLYHICWDHNLRS